MKSIGPIGCILGVIFLAVIVTGTARAADNTEASITIGVLENENYAFAAMMKGSFNLAMARINASGGINGRPIKLVYTQDGGDTAQGVKAVGRLVKVEKPVMLVGGYSSSNTIFLAQRAESLNVPFLVCTAADDRITQRKMRNIYRLNPPASAYATGLEDLLIQKVKPSTVAIIYENSPFGIGGGMQMMWFCRENDIEITAIIPYHKERTAAAYYQRLIEPLKGNPPDVIYMVSYLKDGVSLVKHIRGAGIDSILCAGAGGFTHPDFIKMTGEASKLLMTATLWRADQRHAMAGEYAATYQARYQQEPDYHGAEAYSALMVAADALKRAKSFTAEDIRAAMDQTNLLTPFGPVKFISYEKYERQNSVTTLVLQNIQNKYRCVWPENIAIAKLVVPAR